MNRTEFETMYKAKYLTALPGSTQHPDLIAENYADKFIAEHRTHGGYTDDHLDVCWMEYVKQCAIDDLCEHYQKYAYLLANPEDYEKWINDNPAIKAIFELRSK